VKNADTSTAMLADKMRHVLDTGADVCTAGDASCLMHIGGGLSRLRTGVRTVHLAEILASTEATVPDRPTDSLREAERSASLKEAVPPGDSSGEAEQRGAA
jgi:hypothetical protein